MTAARSAAAHVFVVDLERPEPDDEDWHHLRRVLRLRPGEAVTAGDGAGRWRLCRTGAGPTALEVDGPVITEAPPAPRVAVAFAPVKGDRPEWTVQKLTELGVDLILPFRAARSVVRWEGERARQHLGRLQRVAREAAMQSRRVWLPEFGEMTDLPGVLTQLRAAGIGGVALADPGGDGLSRSTAALLIGPEGGWTEAELGSGPPLVDLGPTVLRAETAALAAGVLLCAQRDGRVAGSGARSA